MLVPSAADTTRRGLVLIAAAGVAVFVQILSPALVGAESSLQDSVSHVMSEPAGALTERAQPLAGDPAQGGNPLWSMPLTALSDTRERPIFSPSRRPPPPPVVAAPYVAPAPPQQPPAPPEPDHPSLTLLGTLAGDGQGVGIFVNEADKSTLRLRTGEDHEGWVLRSVRSGEAIFEKGERTATLALLPSGSAAQALASSVALGNTWRDGDGQMIRPPPRREQKPASPMAAPPSGTWLDGDGQAISAPPKSASTPPAAAPTAAGPAL
jgi:hypothetical protein